MLGLTPAFAAFFGLGLEVRHVTLSTGQIGVAAPRWAWRCCTAGLLVGRGLLPFNGALNVGVSFYLAFRWRCARTTWRRGPLAHLPRAAHAGAARR
jgi:site-specific recombinase